MSQLAIHFHDTYGQALANILACLEEGVSIIHSAVGGLEYTRSKIAKEYHRVGV